ncbi:MAG TPA: flagellar biosynthetic protein FliQ [Candidatus Eremiobacteraceae bacterium]|jgi:flagellar biosynthetic protein FliQ
MPAVVQSLFVNAMQVAALIAMPAVALVACVGIAVGIVQTVVQIQDQNVSFFPKLVAIAAAAAVLGPAALAVLVDLFDVVARALPALARA